MKARINLMNVNPGIMHAMLGLEKQVSKGGLTLVTEGHVPDEVYERVRQEFSEDELAHLSLAIVAINGWNRLNVAARTVPGDYVPGSLATQATS